MCDIAKLALILGVPFTMPYETSPSPSDLMESKDMSLDDEYVTKTRMSPDKDYIKQYHQTIVSNISYIYIQTYIKYVHVIIP